MIEQIAPSLFRIEVPLPGNPLKSLNSYVVRTPERSLIIDTGFNMPECLEAMKEGIAQLGLDLDQCDLFITHYHSDHCGLVTQLVRPGNTVYMSRVDSGFHKHFMSHMDEFWSSRREQVLAIGYPPDEFERSTRRNPIDSLAPTQDFDLVELDDGDLVRLNGLSLRVVLTPGHTEGHACLYWEEEQVLFCGDQLLYSITPNITDWDEADRLGEYLNSLERIRGLQVRMGLAAHRQNGPQDFYTRIDELIAHHRTRLDEVVEIVGSQPGINVYETASRMTWSIRARDWDDFPPTQKWFAVGEAYAHLTYLAKRGVLRAGRDGGVRCYHLEKGAAS